MKGKLLKKVTATALSLLIVSGGIPFQPVADLFGSTVLKAEAATTYNGWSHVNCTNCSVGDIFEAGAELFNNTSSDIYLQFSDDSDLNETLKSREGTIIGIKYRIDSKSGNTWTLTTLRSNTSITAEPDVNGIILYDGTAKNIIESGAAVSGNQTVYYGISEYYYGEPSAWYSNINDSHLKVTDIGEYFLWINSNGDGNYKPLSPSVRATITVTDQADMLQSYYWGGSNQDGTQSRPFIISDKKGWNFLCEALQYNNVFNHFEGKYFQLNNNITVDRMAGDSNHAFGGIFNGNGKKLTFNYTANDTYTAPFRVVNGTGNKHAVISNLNVESNITSTSYKHLGGLIALQTGYVDVQNCTVKVNISSTTTGTDKDLYPSGIVSQAAKDNDGTLTVSGCKVTGEIKTNGKYAAGIVSVVQGKTNIDNSLSSVKINSSTDGDGTHGGLVGVTSSGSTLNITGCVFNGKFIGSNTHAWGGFVGWRQSTANIYNSVFAPSEIDIKQSKEKCATFARNKIDTYNCYFTETLNDGTNYLPYVDDDTVTPRKCNNGLKAYTISATDGITLALSGTATTYNVSGITAYADNCGLKYGNTVYAGNGDRVALTLPETEQYQNYAVNAGTLNGSTLTMPAENVTISMFTGGTTGDCTWTLDKNNVLTISGNGAMDNYTHYTAPWGKNVKSVIIKQGVTNVGNYAFYDCTSLTSVTIPNSVTSIGGYAFRNTAFTSITIPNSVTSIGYFAFSSCNALTNVTIPDSVTSIGDSTFSICGNLKSVSFGKGLTRINDFMFSGCSNLTTVTIQNKVTSIGKYAFNKCTKLSGITIPESVTTIGEKAFYECKSLTNITLPGSVTSIGDSAFYGCNTLSGVTLSEGLNTISSNAFHNCTALKSVFIPESVTSIGSHAFGCYDNNNNNGSVYIMMDFMVYGYKNSKAENYAKTSGLKFTAVPKIVSSGTTGDCTWTLDEDGLLTISGNGAMANNAYVSAPWGRNIKSVIIENGVTTIGKCAFFCCSALTSVTIPNSVTTIGDGAFYHCTNLKSITIPDSVTTIGREAFYCCSALTSITIPNKVTTISDSAFYYCTSLTSFTIPNNITTIDEEAFYGCANLTSITIPNSVTSIGASAFCKCTALTSVTIPNSITSLKSYVFADCTNLVSVTISNSVTSISYSAFDNCTSLESITIPNSVTHIGGYAFDNCTSLTSITIPNSVTSIGNYVFYNCSSLESVTITNGITTIGDYVFDKCVSLTNITIPNSVAAIGEYAFSECTGLTSVTIPDSVTTIGEYAFADCTNLTSVTIPNSVTSINNYLFMSCSALESVIIPANVKTISEGAFFKCTGLTSVTIPDSVTTIGEYAFADCTNLTSVTISNSVTTIGERAVGYYYSDDNNDYVKTDGFTIYGHKGSAAENYANENGFVFVPTVESVDLNKHTLTLGVGQSYTLRPIVTPEGAETTFKWKSSKKDIATVTSLGKVTGRAVGKATITVTTANGKTYSCSVIVKQAPDSITLNKSEMTLGVGQMYTLQSTLTPSNSATYQQWTSSNKSVAVVNDKGRVTGKKVGTATITVKTTNGHTATCVVTVKKAPTSVALNKTATTLAVGMKETLIATLTPTDCATYCMWTSDDETVVTVTSNGVITAKKVGTTTVTVKTTNGHTAACTVTVRKAPTALALDKTELSLKVGETYTLKKTLTPANAYTTYTYASSKTAVATITSSGKVVAKKAGTAVITVTTHNGHTATCTVTVK